MAMRIASSVLAKPLAEGLQSWPAASWPRRSTSAEKSAWSCLKSPSFALSGGLGRGQRGDRPRLAGLLVDLDDLTHQAPGPLVVGDLALGHVQRRPGLEVRHHGLPGNLLAEDVILAVARMTVVGADAVGLATPMPNGVERSRTEVTYVAQLGVHPLSFALELGKVGRR